MSSSPRWALGIDSMLLQGALKQGMATLDALKASAPAKAGKKKAGKK